MPIVNQHQATIENLLSNLSHMLFAKIGPVDIQTEINYANGNLKSYDNASLVQTLNWKT